MVDDSNVVKIGKTKAKKEAAPDSWKANLIVNERDRTPKGCLLNAAESLRNAPAWEGVLAFDEFSQRTMCVAPPPWFPWDKEDQWIPRPWTDVDDIKATEWLQRNGIMVQPQTTADAAQSVSDDRKYHPVRNYLGRLRWDGVRRLPTWTSRYLGVEPTMYTEAVGIRWMVSAVARIFQPGCKADCALILKGKQDLKKSTALAILGGEWFTDQLSDLGSKDSSGDLQGAWIIELAEMDTVGRAEMSTVKAFLSRVTDRFRPSYGRRTQEFPRQCVFAGTVNPEGGIFKDPTGARRFWPIECTLIDADALERDRDQLWAEAVCLYDEGATWWLDTSELKEAAQAVQADDYVGDVWDNKIADYLATRDEASVSDILENALFITTSHQGKKEQMRVGGILTSMGWVRVKLSTDKHGKRPWGYRRNR